MPSAMHSRHALEFVAGNAAPAIGSAVSAGSARTVRRCTYAFDLLVTTDGCYTAIDDGDSLGGPVRVARLHHDVHQAHGAQRN